MFIASAPTTTTTFASGNVPLDVEAQIASFTYAFEPADPFQTAFYTIGTNSFPLPDSLGTTLTLAINPGEQLLFGISSIDSSNPAFLTITNFSSVPAPLPVLGGAAAFGWIRRRRAFLRNSSIAIGTSKR
jgi:hypothetical protein